MALTGTVDAANARVDLFVDWTDQPGTQLTGTLFRRVGDVNGEDQYVRGLYQGELLGEQWYVSDHEAPLDQQVWYAATSPESATTLIAGPFTVDSGGYVWMKDPGRPWADLRVDLCNSPSRSIAPDCDTNPPTVTDTFSRTVASSWGTADTGQTWTVTNGPPADFSVSGGNGHIVASVPNSARRVIMPSPFADTDMRIDIAPAVLALGGNLTAGLVARTPAATDFYGVRLDFTPTFDGLRVGLVMVRRLANVDTTLRSVDTLMTYTAGQFFTLRFQVQGSNLRARAWPTGTAEPDAWVTAVDGNLTAAASLGVRAFSSSLNVNPNPDMLFDNFSVSSFPDATDDIAWVGFKDKNRAADAGIFPVLNRERPADVYARRKDIVTAATFLTRTLTAVCGVYELYTAGGPILYQLPSVYGWYDWVAQPDTLTESYISNDQRKPWRLWDVPLTVVDTPVGEPQGTDTANWCAVRDTYATFADLTAAGFTWGQVAAGQAASPPVELGYGSGPYGSGPYGDGG